LNEKLFQIKSFLTYWLDAVDEHSLHSPFYFDFYTGVVKAKSQDYASIESLRKKLLEDNRAIAVKDLGSKRHLTNSRTLSSIARTSLSSPKFSAFFHRVIQKYDHKTVIELGTSLGINTLYLAAKKDAKISTFEGSPELAAIAAITFDFAAAKNITLVEGDIDSTLPDFLQKHRKIDFAFIDANHTYAATMRYFRAILSKIHETSVIIIDDIHASGSMEKAWKEIISNDLVYGSADLFRCGALFFDPSLNKQHVILQF
jgi:predicted O-methyltransferase YrrM